MNNYDPNKTKEIQKRMLENFSHTKFFRDAGISNIFKVKEEENKVKFKKYTVEIPWYLKLFDRVITDIAYSSFKDGLSENCTDTVTIKRPSSYVAKDNE